MDRFPSEYRTLACWLALHHTDDLGPVAFAALLKQVSSIETIFEQPDKLLGISNKIQAQLLKPNWQRVEADLEWLNDSNRHIVTLQDSDYPELLKQITDPPPIIYVQGNLALLAQWQLAIVGSRHPSESGRQSAFEFAHYLAKGGLTVTSGLAMGIDAAAHQGALAADGKTIAAIGTGLDRVYPAKHRELAHDIANNGAIVSEFALGTAPKAENFPRRNRIISALSLGTLVVEAALKSGSLITARMAMEQAREVFAIPGSIHNPLARGCHKLIREGAKLVETASDILDELGALALAQVNDEKMQSESVAGLSAELDKDYQLLLGKLGYEPMPIGILIERCGLTAEAVSSMLLLLELKGQVQSLAGGRYVRT